MASLSSWSDCEFSSSFDEKSVHNIKHALASVGLFFKEKYPYTFDYQHYPYPTAEISKEIVLSLIAQDKELEEKKLTDSTAGHMCYLVGYFFSLKQDLLKQKVAGKNLSRIDECVCSLTLHRDEKVERAPLLDGALAQPSQASGSSITTVLNLLLQVFSKHAERPDVAYGVRSSLLHTMLDKKVLEVAEANIVGELKPTYSHYKTTDIIKVLLQGMKQAARVPMGTPVHAFIIAGRYVGVWSIVRLPIPLCEFTPETFHSFMDSCKLAAEDTIERDIARLRNDGTYFLAKDLLSHIKIKEVLLPLELTPENIDDVRAIFIKIQRAALGFARHRVSTLSAETTFEMDSDFANIPFPYLDWKPGCAASYFETLRNSGSEQCILIDRKEGIFYKRYSNATTPANEFKNLAHLNKVGVLDIPEAMLPSSRLEADGWVQMKLIGKRFRTLGDKALRSVAAQKYNGDLFFDIMEMLMELVLSLHNQRCILADIRPDNILVFKRHEQLKLIDFGASLIVNDKDDSKLFDQYHVPADTYGFMAPEAMNEHKLGFKSDCYSIAMTAVNILYEIDGRQSNLLSVDLKQTMEEHEDAFAAVQKRLTLRPLLKFDKGTMRKLEDWLRSMSTFDYSKRASLDAGLTKFHEMKEQIKQGKMFKPATKPMTEKPPLATRTTEVRPCANEHDPSTSDQFLLGHCICVNISNSESETYWIQKLKSHGASVSSQMRKSKNYTELFIENGNDKKKYQRIAHRRGIPVVGPDWFNKKWSQTPSIQSQVNNLTQQVNHLRAAKKKLILAESAANQNPPLLSPHDLSVTALSQGTSSNIALPHSPPLPQDTHHSSTFAIPVDPMPIPQRFIPTEMQVKPELSVSTPHTQAAEAVVLIAPVTPTPSPSTDKELDQQKKKQQKKVPSKRKTYESSDEAEKAIPSSKRQKRSAEQRRFWDHCIIS